MCKILCIIFVVILKRIFYVWVSTGTLQENRPVDTAGEGEGGANWEGSIEAYTLPAVKQTDSGSLLYDAESSNSVLCDNLEECDGVQGGLRKRGHMHTYGWLMLMFGRNQHNIVKQLSSN